jgi:hypothetical protein
LAEHFKFEPDHAREIVAIRWMRRGDLRPLATLPSLDGPVLNELRVAKDDPLGPANRQA